MGQFDNDVDAVPHTFEEPAPFGYAPVIGTRIVDDVLGYPQHRIGDI